MAKDYLLEDIDIDEFLEDLGELEVREEKRRIEEEEEEELLKWLDETLGLKKTAEEQLKKYAFEGALCPICGNTVSIFDKRCPNCGAEFALDVVRCAVCGELIPPDSLVCPECGNTLLEQKTLCPRCGTIVSSSETVCPNCGVEFAPDLFRCANCGALVDINTIVCPECGTLLIEEAKPKEEVEEKLEKVKAEEVKAEALKVHIGGGEEGEGMPAEISVDNIKIVQPTLQVAPMAAAPARRRSYLHERREEHRAKRILFPFAAIVDQEAMKLGLILNAIDPMVGGLLIMGQKGTAKSVAVRGLSEILPEIKVIKGCRYNDDPDDPETWCWECKEKYANRPPPVEMRPIPIVDLPLNATEDRVVGTIDVERILREGVKAFEPGILAEANRGILYIDEINLLDDYIVDLILDAAAMGVVTVEREGISVSYPARFVIVGTMNPEEGALRPQLLDRLGLVVKVKGVEKVEDRIEIIKRREEFNRDPMAFREKWREEQEKLKARIIEAREKLNSIKISDRIIKLIAELCARFGVDGHRADIIITRAARAIAAFEGRDEVTINDVARAAEMALPHRMRKKPFEEEEFSSERLRRLIEEIEGGL